MRSWIRVYGVSGFTLAALLLLDGLISGAAVQAAPPAHCPGAGVPASGAVVRGGLIVDGVCQLSQATIDGGVTITTNGHLILLGSTVNGGVTVNAGGEFDSGTTNGFDFAAPSTIHGSVVDQHGVDLDIHGGTVDGGVTLNGAGAFDHPTICGATVHGDVTVENMGGSLGAVVGDVENDAAVGVCHANQIDGTVRVLNSPNLRIEVEANRIRGAVLIDNSTPSLSGNTITGSVSCTGGAQLHVWDADDTNQNSVTGANTCL